MKNSASPFPHQMVSSSGLLPRKHISVLDAEMNYVDAGVGDPVVFLHGNPTSSYLWRNIIPHLTDHARCLAPDLMGMGHSGKPASTYTFDDQVRYLDEWFLRMNLHKNVTLVVHDWGSALGFYWANRHAHSVKAIVYMEAIVQPRLWSDFQSGRDVIFRALRSEKGEEMIFDQNVFLEMVLPKSIIRSLSAEELEAYHAPFRNKASRVPMLQFARHLPIDGHPASVVKIVDEYGKWLASSPIPKLLINAAPGALLTGRNLEFARTWVNQEEVTVTGIHYIQEDSPNEIGEAIRKFYLGLDR